jgi:hypothetical protein
VNLTSIANSCSSRIKAAFTFTQTKISRAARESLRTRSSLRKRKSLTKRGAEEEDEEEDNEDEDEDEDMTRSMGIVAARSTRNHPRR